MQPIRVLAPLAGPALRVQPDRRLVTLVREGQERAFDEIVRRYRPSLVRFAAGFVADDRAEDVVQESLASAYTAMAGTGQEITLRPWLYRIVRNGALNELRGARHLEPLSDEFDGVPQPPDIVERRQRLREVVGGLQALPAGQRQALVQRELEGASYDEIAAALDTSPGAARQLIFRGRAAMREALGLLLPLPAVRVLLEAAEPGAKAAAASGVLAGGAAGAAGGGGAAGVKAGAAIAVAALAVGGGVALERRGANERSSLSEANAAEPGEERDGGSRAQAAGGASAASAAGANETGRAERGEDSGGPGPDSGSGSGSSDGSSSGPSRSSGPGGGDDSSSGSSGPGGGGESGGGEDFEEELDDSSGPGSGDLDGGLDDGDSSGPGGGDDLETDDAELDESSGPGSTSSGSGSSDSGSSGSGSSGSGDDDLTELE